MSHWQVIFGAVKKWNSFMMNVGRLFIGVIVDGVRVV